MPRSPESFTVIGQRLAVSLNGGHFFFKLLTKQFKCQFNAISVDEFIGQFKLKFPDQFCPSTPTVYRYIDQGRLTIKNLDLPQKLSRHLKRHHRSHSRQAVKRLGVSIEKRPLEINQRQHPFDWEGDLVKGVRRKNQPALMTLTERLTRFEIVIKIPNYQAETCRQELQKVINLV
jgi:IS30 family transposase